MNGGTDSWRGAPEVGKAQLKLLLASFTDAISSSHSLDTADIPDNLSFGDGINGELENIAIYNNHQIASGFNLARLRRDFGGHLPDAVIVINAGSSWGDDALYTLLLDAAVEGVGILTIGDASVLEARNMDPNKTTFPIMGVQNWYRFKVYSGDNIREFKFLEGNEEDVDGGIFEIADTVHVRSDWEELSGRGRVEVHRIVKGEYAAAFSPQDVIYQDYGDSVSSHPDVDNFSLIDYTEDINGVTHEVEVLHSSGTFSIYSKAVEVVQQDRYDPKMDAGVYVNAEVIVGYEPSEEVIYVVDSISWENTGDGPDWPGNADWGAEIWIEDELVVRRGEVLPDLSGVNLQKYGEYVPGKDAFRFDTDYTITANDREILVIPSGRHIAGFARGQYGDSLKRYDSDPEEPVNYLGIFGSGGYLDLKINLFTEGDRELIFTDVLPQLRGAGVNELVFRDWKEDNGRLRAAADIWAFNENLDLRPFTELLDPNSGKDFDRDAYYVSYLGNQVAGREEFPHFVRPPENAGEFSAPADSMRYDRAGYDESGKLYNAISVVQTGRRRLGMLGFQPSYLDNYEFAEMLLEDITIWIASDNFRMPDPEINTVYGGDTLPADGRRVYRDLDSIEIAVDFSIKGNRIRTADYAVHLSAKYRGNTYSWDEIEVEGDSTAEMRYHYFSLKDQITIDPAHNDDDEDRDISFEVDIRPVESGQFDMGDAEGSVKIKKLASPDIPFEDEEFVDELEIELTCSTDVEGNGVDDDVYIHVVTPEDPNSGDDIISPYTYVLRETSPVHAYAAGDRYLHSDIAESEEEFVRLADLPESHPDILPSDVSSGAYLFYSDTALTVRLDSTHDNYPVLIPDYDEYYRIRWSGGISGAAPAEPAEIETPHLLIDSLIRTGSSFLDITLQTVPDESQDDNFWVASEETDYTYAFRQVHLTIEHTSGDSLSDSLGITFTAEDTLGGIDLDDTDIYYTTQGGNLDTTDASTYDDVAKPGSEVTIPNGVVLEAVGYRSGYLPNNRDDATEIFTRDAEIRISVDDSTAFGDSLVVTINANMSPVYTTVAVADENVSIEKVWNERRFQVVLDVGSPVPGDSVDVDFTVRIEGNEDENIEGAEKERLFFRRQFLPVDISPDEGEYFDDVTVSFYHPHFSDTADIFYTHDGTAPDETTEEYLDSFTIEPPADIRAVALVRPDLVDENGAGGWLAAPESGRSLQRGVRQLPQALSLPPDTAVNGQGRYFFFDEEADLELLLDTGDQNFSFVEKGEFSIVWKGSAVSGETDLFSHEETVSREYVDDLIALGDKDISFVLQAESRSLFWDDSEPQEYSYDFRTMNLSIDRSDWSPEKDFFNTAIYAHDAVTGDTLWDARIEYTYGSRTDLVSSGEMIKDLPNGDILSAKARRSGYIPVEDDYLGLFSREGHLSLEVENLLYPNRGENGIHTTVHSNLSDISYRVVQEIDGRNKEIIDWTNMTEGETAVLSNELFIHENSAVKVFARGDALLDKAGDTLISAAEADTSFTLRKLPALQMTAEQTFSGMLDIVITSSRKDEEDFQIIYIVDDGTEKIYDDDLVLEESSTITAWSKAQDWFNSDTLRREYKREKHQLPPALSLPDPDEVNGRGDYLFFSDTSFVFYLDSSHAKYPFVVAGDFEISWDFFSDTGDTEQFFYTPQISLDDIDAAVENGNNALSVDLAVTSLSPYWDDGDDTEFLYDFREVALSIEQTGGDRESDSLDIEITAYDDIDDTPLEDARIYYTIEDTEIDTSLEETYTGIASFGEEITVPNGIVFTAVGYRSGYIPNAPAKGKRIFTREAVILVEPGDQKAFGDSLLVTVNSNLSPIFYSINGEGEERIDALYGEIVIQSGDPDPGDSVEIGLDVWVEGKSEDSIEYIEGAEESRTYYRRRLPSVVATPPGGKYTASVEIELGHSVTSDSSFIVYSFDSAATKNDILYDGPFEIVPDITLWAASFVIEDVVKENGVGGWLPSPNTEENYRRVTTGVEEGSAYYDRSSSQKNLDADGIIDVAIVELSERWKELELPDSAACIFPGTSDTLMVSGGIEWEDPDEEGNPRIYIPVDFEDMKTGFSADEYITLYGPQYIEESIPVGDSIAPVIYRAAYLSGEFSVDGDRTEDTLIVEFSEATGDVTRAVTEEELFLFGSYEESYGGLFTFHKQEDDSTVVFLVNELHGRMYPYSTDSAWIDVAAITSVRDSENNIQKTALNRRVPMQVDELKIRVKMDAFWIRNNPDFRRISSYDDFGTVLSGESIDISLGGMIVIDPQVGFHESEVQNEDFDAEISILDEVGNVIVSTSGRHDDADNICAVPMKMNTFDGDNRFVIVVAWDGTNNQGRQVHSRSYKIIGTTYWPIIQGSVSVQGMIPLIRKRWAE
ncbi:MAG: chitobiase/beta-hexosaminidase C-terminal domain-containing protein [Fibrobacterota bacterium]